MTVNWYRHYKGVLYRLLMEGVHTETEEEMVVYQGTDGRVWIRPKQMFFENVKGRPRFARTQDPDTPRWRPIPDWCEDDGKGWQISDCGQLRDTGSPQYEYNLHDEVCGVRYESVDFSPCSIYLYGDFGDGWREGTFDFSELKKAALTGRPPNPIRLREFPETD